MRNRENRLGSVDRKRILVADCHHDSLILLEKMLEDAGFDTTTVWTATEALNLLRTRGFDLLLVNEYLPDADCDHLLQVLTEEGGGLPCIMMQPSAPAITNLARFKALGVCKIVGKRAYPEILAAVRKCLSPKESEVHSQRACLERRQLMFDELDQAITNDRDKDVTRGERTIRYLLIALLSVVIFGGIFLGVWFLEY